MAVREIVGEGSEHADLVLMLDDAGLGVENRPLPVTGGGLARRAEAAGSDPVRRTA